MLTRSAVKRIRSTSFFPRLKSPGFERKPGSLESMNSRRNNWSEARLLNNSISCVVNLTLICVIGRCGHFPVSPVIDGIESRDDFFQLNQAQPAHTILQAMARKDAAYPTGQEMNKMAGLKMKATASSATVVV